MNEVEVVDSATLSLRASSRRIRAGGIVAVDVILDSDLADLRGYQLHLDTSGGKRGRLELRDILIREPAQHKGTGGHAFAGLGYWEAYNAETGQMVAGLDAEGVGVPSGTYLATFVYQASSDAAGEFTIDVLHSDKDLAQRTFLFPTPSSGKIAIDATTSAVVRVTHE
jgi:hypothetical protein